MENVKVKTTATLAMKENMNSVKSIQLVLEEYVKHNKKLEKHVQMTMNVLITQSVIKVPV